jgi:hypothetical protein
VIADRYRTTRETVFADCVADVDALIDAGLVGLTAETASQLAAARVVLARVPAVILKAVLRRGGRVRIIAGQHIDGFRGLTTFDSVATVAGDEPDAEVTLLHELGHLADRVKTWRWISASDSWMKIWARDRNAGMVPDFAGQENDPSEYFAECFSVYWIGDRAKLSPAVQEFLRTMPKKFDPPSGGAVHKGP